MILYRPTDRFSRSDLQKIKRLEAECQRNIHIMFYFINLDFKFESSFANKMDKYKIRIRMIITLNL